MKAKNKKRWAITITTGTIILMALMITFLKWPSYVFTLDINPSLEITTNRMGQFVDVKGLNDDGREFLEDYEVKDRNLEDAINDLIDRMILTGYISGGEDNVVMISVNNDELDKAYLEKVNTAIAAYLENKQLEYLILNQGFDDEFDDSDYQDMSKGKATIVQKIINQDSELSAEELANVSLKDLLIIADRLDLSPQEVFARSIGEYDLDDDKDFDDDKEIDAVAGASVNLEQDEDDRDDNDDKDEASNSISEVIGRERAIEIAKDRIGGGEVEEFEYDQDDQKYEIELRYEGYGYEGYGYEVEINAITGTIVSYEQDKDFDDDKEIDALAGASVNLEQDDDRDDDEDRDDDDKEEASDTTEEVIGRERAIKIAKDRIGGGDVESFEYDRDDQEYEIELKYEGYEYEVEINAITGVIVSFEQDE